MTSRTTEIAIRDKTKQVLKHLQEGDLEKARQIILNYKEVLRYNLGLANFVPLIPRIRFSRTIPKNLNALRMIIDTGYRIYLEEDNVDELLFFAAAKCDVEKLKYCVSRIVTENPNGINQTREGDTALLFLIKYGNLADENCLECMKMLIEAGIDVNKNDYFSHNPTLFLISLYKRYAAKNQKDDIILSNLKNSIQLILDSKMVDASSIETEKDVLEDFQFEGLSCYKQEINEEQQADKLFKYLINNDEESFMKSKEVSQFLNADDGHNSLLQLCCEKNLKEAAKFLIKNGADLCKTTERNPKSPLEIAARRNHEEIFAVLLHENKIVIDEQLFLIFLRNRPKHIKAKYFEEILKYKNLDVNIRSNNGNTPLHYAIIFSCSEAVELLLERGASLTVENDSKKCPLDYISAEDLENRFNKCVMRDSYNDVNSGKYEVALNYESLVQVDDTGIISELSVLKKICNSPLLCHLINHPLVSSFIDVKWKLVANFYRSLFIFQLLFYTLGILSYFNLQLLNYLGKILIFAYSCRIAALFNWKTNKVHQIVDIAIVFIILLSISYGSSAVKYQLGVIATIFMAVSFHLFWRFSPKFSEFHAILINITSHIFSYLSYTFVLTLFFGAACYIFFLLKYDNDVAFDVDNMNIFDTLKFILSQFYLLCAVGVFISIMIMLTIINSFVYLQENLSENIRNNFKISGYRNVLIFLECAEKLYNSCRLITNPFIFSDVNVNVKKNGDSEKGKKKQKKSGKSKKFIVNFLVNANKFLFERLLYIKLDEINAIKIRRMIINNKT